MILHDPKKAEQLAKLLSEWLYAQITSTEKSEEYCTGFLEIDRGDKQRNYARIRKFCNHYGECVKEEMKNKEGELLSESDKEVIHNKCFQQAKIKLKEEDGQQNSTDNL